MYNCAFLRNIAQNCVILGKFGNAHCAEVFRRDQIMPMSPAAAAKRAGVSRSVVSRALKDGKLRGVRKNNGHWSIPEDALDEWLSSVTTRAPAEPKPALEAPEHHPDDLARIEQLEAELKAAIEAGQGTREELAAMKATIEEVRKSLDDLRNDRDAWRDQAQRLASEARPVGIFARLFRR